MYVTQFGELYFMLNKIKNNLNTSSSLQKDDLNSKIYILFKGFMIAYDEYNEFFKTEVSEISLNANIFMKITKDEKIDFFDKEHNLICLYSYKQKSVAFTKYYQTPEIEKKMSLFLLKKIPEVSKKLKDEVNKFILQKQESLLCILEQKLNNTSEDNKSEQEDEIEFFTAKLEIQEQKTPEHTQPTPKPPASSPQPKKQIQAPLPPQSPNASSLEVEIDDDFFNIG